MSDAGRYHLVLTAEGRPLQHGWWGKEAVARGKLARWVGEYGTLSAASVTLTDESTGAEVTRWPDRA